MMSFLGKPRRKAIIFKLWESKGGREPRLIEKIKKSIPSTTTNASLQKENLLFTTKEISLHFIKYWVMWVITAQCLDFSIVKHNCELASEIEGESFDEYVRPSNDAFCEENLFQIHSSHRDHPRIKEADNITPEPIQFCAYTSFMSVLKRNVVNCAILGKICFSASYHLFDYFPSKTKYKTFI